MENAALFGASVIAWVVTFVPKCVLNVAFLAALVVAVLAFRVRCGALRREARRAQDVCRSAGRMLRQRRAEVQGRRSIATHDNPQINTRSAARRKQTCVTAAHDQSQTPLSASLQDVETGIGVAGSGRWIRADRSVAEALDRFGARMPDQFYREKLPD